MTPMQPVRFEDGGPRLFTGLRERHAFAAAAAGIAGQWRRFLELPSMPERVGTAFYGVMCGSDAAGVEYLAGIEVSSFDTVPPDLGRVRAAPQRYAVFEHHGPDLGASWRGILGWLDEGPFESAHRPDFEIYPSRADGTPDADDVEIWVAVVPRRVSRASP